MTSPFHTTSWSLISCTREPGETARLATAALCRLYWHALYVYARRAGQSAHESEDTVQDFLVHVVENEVFAHAEADRGRFRTFLLAALRQFLARRHRDRTRQKRSPDTRLLSLDLERAERTLTDTNDDSPEKAFDRAWAATQLDLTWERLEREYGENGKTALFSHLRPVVSGQSDATTREIATGLNMTEGAVNVAAHRLRRRFGEALREQVAQTLISADEVDEEIGRLRAALAGTA